MLIRAHRVIPVQDFAIGRAGACADGFGGVPVSGDPPRDGTENEQRERYDDDSEGSAHHAPPIR
jgi:hypothetical protein